MTDKKTIAFLTIVMFIITIISGSFSTLFPQSVNEDSETAKLLKKAEEYYENGNFDKAIEVYESVIKMLNEKKELAETKQKLVQTILSLSLTYFTIQENQKARTQLEKLISINPKQELDPEFYPPKFISIFNDLQKEHLGSLQITSIPEKADIYLNNIKIGKTPIKLNKYLKGEYTLVAKLKGFAIHTQTISITPGIINKIEIPMQSLKKPLKSKVIEKETTKPKIKKKKFPVLLVLGGVAVVTILAVLLLGSKSEKEPESIAKDFWNKQPAEIFLIVGGISFIQVEGIPLEAEIEKVEYYIKIQHPAMEDLLISILGTDNLTNRIVWNRQNSPDNPTEMRGAATTFNTLNPNGNWKLVVNNKGAHKGKILEWLIRIHYKIKQ